MEKTIPKLPFSLHDIQFERCRRSYAYYVEHSHQGRWIAGKAPVFVADKIQEFIQKDTGHAFDIFILQMPPQHSKSMTVTETLPSWYMGKYPLNRIIQTSYNEDTALRFCRRNKEKIELFGKSIFGIEISKKVNTQTEFELSNNVGRMISRGVMSSITSNPANLLIIDDPIKNRQEADSETYRDRLWDEWQNTLKTRLSAGAKVILIMTRWHEDDLAGRIIKNECNFTLLNLPCEAEIGDLLLRAEGEALFPEIGKDNKWLAEFKQGYKSVEGSRAWEALFQGHPTAQEGNIVSRKWWKYYKDLPPIALMIMSVDATFKDGENSDFVAIEIWGKTGANMYLIDLINKKMDFTETVKAIRKMKSNYPKCRTILIEDKANGSAIISVLRHEIPGIIPINPEGGKVARVNAISPAIESGNVYLPENKDFTADFVNQFSSFPNGKHDDMVDAASQALNRLIYRKANITGEENVSSSSYDAFFNRKQTGSILGGQASKSLLGGNVKF